jgi:hypothetical protein
MDAMSAGLDVLRAGRGATSSELGGAAGRGVAIGAETATNGRGGAAMRGGFGVICADVRAGGTETLDVGMAGATEVDAKAISGTGGAADGAGAGGADAVRGMEIWVADGAAI